MTPPAPEKQEGLKLKYIVKKADGTDVSPDSDYFLLKLNSRTLWHRNASLLAIMAYAAAVEKDCPQLAKDIKKKYGNEIPEEIRQHPAPPKDTDHNWIDFEQWLINTPFPQDSRKIVAKILKKTCAIREGIIKSTAPDTQRIADARMDLLKELQTFIDDADSREGCPLGTLQVAALVRWMSARGYDCD